MILKKKNYSIFYLYHMRYHKIAKNIHFSSMLEWLTAHQNTKQCNESK